MATENISIIRKIIINLLDLIDLSQLSMQHSFTLIISKD